MKLDRPTSNKVLSMLTKNNSSTMGKKTSNA